MAKSGSVTRREFVKGAVTAAAAVAAPYIVPARALGRSGFTAPSERLTMGFIGVGNMGGGHLHNFLNTDEVQIVAISDVDAVKRGDARKKVIEHYAAKTQSGTYDGCEEYNEFELLLARPDIDIVLIAVPDHWHAMIAIAACKAGKDVYCEKPAVADDSRSGGDGSGGPALQHGLSDRQPATFVSQLPAGV